MGVSCQSPGSFGAATPGIRPYQSGLCSVFERCTFDSRLNPCRAPSCAFPVVLLVMSSSHELGRFSEVPPHVPSPVPSLFPHLLNPITLPTHSNYSIPPQTILHFSDALNPFINLNQPHYLPAYYLPCRCRCRCRCHCHPLPLPSSNTNKK